MRRFGKLLAGIALFAPVLTGPLAAAAPSLPSSVTCVYDAMPQEQRDIANGLFAATASRGVNPLKDTDTMDAIKALIGSAHNTCLDLYPWSVGQSGNAQGFAFASWMSDLTVGMLKALGRNPEDIDSYYTANKARLGIAISPTAAQITDLVAHLKTLGWTFDDTHAQGLAATHLEARFKREWYRRGFGEGVMRAPPRKVAH